jgi:DNA-binding NarL/FixJ family response regulator
MSAASVRVMASNANQRPSRRKPGVPSIDLTPVIRHQRCRPRAGPPWVSRTTIRTPRTRPCAIILERVRHGEAASVDPLSPRETEIVKLVAEGYSSMEIGELLHISDKTVERHRANVLDKLGLRDRVALTRYAIRRGLVEP